MQNGNGKLLLEIFLQVGNDLGDEFKVGPLKDLLMVDMKVRETSQNYSIFLSLNVPILQESGVHFLYLLYTVF